MHHRYPTSTINVRQAAHPFSTQDYFGDNQYILIHNGSIRNASDLYEQHRAQGIAYRSLLKDLTYNDSEALLWDFALYMEGKQKELKVAGGIAFICLKLVKGKLEKMYFARNTNPLNLFRDKHGIVLSSQGEGEPIDRDKLYTWNYALKRLTTRPLFLPGYVYNADSYYSGYLPKEYKQPSWEEQGYDWESAYSYPDWLPAGLGDKFDKYLHKKNIDKQIDNAITYDDIDSVVRQYLMACNGHFESAYWAIEADYYDMLDDLEVQQDLDLKAEVRLLEKALSHIMDDPEYLNEDSVASDWRNVWQQQNLAQ